MINSETAACAHKSKNNIQYNLNDLPTNDIFA